MKQKFLLLFVVIATAINASAYDFEVDGFYYNILSEEDLTCEVTYMKGYDAYLGDVVIPSSVTYSGKTFSVTSIGNLAFYGCSSLTSVEIPNSVTSIEQYAFFGCSGLTSVETPNSVTTIGEGAFNGCTNLTLVVIGSSAKTIGQYAFSGCSSLTSVEIPNSVTSIGNQAFYNCSSLKEIILLAVTPPRIDFDTFEEVSKEDCVLIVLDESAEAYKAADGWKEFFNIVGIATGISTPTANDFRKDDKAYKLNGTEANDGYRGIVIKNVKKVLRK